MSWRDCKGKVRVVFIGQREIDAGWPHHLFNVDAEMKKLKEKLLRIQNRVKNIEFYGWDLIISEFEASKLLPELEEADGILAIPLTQEFADGNLTPHPPLIQLADTGKPMIVYTQPFSTYWDQGSVLERIGRVTVINSSEIEDIIPALEAMRAVIRMKHIKILLIKDYEYSREHIDPRLRDVRWIGPSFLKRIKEIFGITVVRIGLKELMEAYNNASAKEAEKIAEEFIRNAEAVKGPSREDIVKAARMYLAVKSLLVKYGCNAWTWDCLTYIRAKALPISLCFAVSRLNDEGIPSGCEAEMDSMLTMIMCHTLAEKPCYMGDPVLDESRNALIIAHCTSATRMLGYDEKPFPYIIRNHAESWRDVGLEVEMKPGDVTVSRLIGITTMKAMSFPLNVISIKFNGYSLMAAKTRLIGSMKHEWGCRTKAVLQLTEDPDEFKRNFYCEHKIICYGDWIKQLKALTQFLGIKFVNKLYLPID